MTDADRPFLTEDLLAETLYLTPADRSAELTEGHRRVTVTWEAIAYVLEQKGVPFPDEEADDIFDRLVALEAQP